MAITLKSEDKYVEKCSTAQSFIFPKWHSFKIGTLIDQGFRIHIHANNGARADMPWAFFISPIYDYAQHSFRALMPGIKPGSWQSQISDTTHKGVVHPSAIVYSIVFTIKEIYFFIFDNKTFKLHIEICKRKNTLRS